MNKKKEATIKKVMRESLVLVCFLDLVTLRCNLDREETLKIEIYCI